MRILKLKEFPVVQDYRIIVWATVGLQYRVQSTSAQKTRDALESNPILLDF